MRPTDQPLTWGAEGVCYDTVNFDARVLQLAIDFAGVDHILAGSDYRHLIGSLEKMLASIQCMELRQ